MQHTINHYTTNPPPVHCRPSFPQGPPMFGLYHAEYDMAEAALSLSSVLSVNNSAVPRSPLAPPSLPPLLYSLSSLEASWPWNRRPMPPSNRLHGSNIAPNQPCRPTRAKRSHGQEAHTLRAARRSYSGWWGMRLPWVPNMVVFFFFFLSLSLFLSSPFPFQRLDSWC
jgi:hypothetical protein